jgi:hypothetical protein
MDGYVSQTIPVIVSDGALDWPLLREADLNLDFIAKVCVASTAPKDGNKQNKNKTNIYAAMYCIEANRHSFYVCVYIGVSR